MSDSLGFAKIEGGVVIQFPYSIENLKEENPSTKFDQKTHLPLLYDLTEEGESSNFSIVEVFYDDITYDFDFGTQTIILDDFPSLIEGRWVLKTHIVELDLDGVNTEAPLAEMGYGSE